MLLHSFGGVSDGIAFCIRPRGVGWQEDFIAETGHFVPLLSDFGHTKSRRPVKDFPLWGAAGRRLIFSCGGYHLMRKSLISWAISSARETINGCEPVSYIL